MKNIAILASGSGSNANAIMSYFQNSEEVSVNLVIYNRLEAGVALRAAEHRVRAQYVSGSDFIHNSEEVLLLFQECKIDIVILAGFLLIVPPKILKAYPDRILNIHPSLLPLYGGRGMYGINVHQAVIDNNEKRTGITIHLVNEKIDKGRTLFQAECEVEPSDSAEILQARVLLLEHKHYPQVIENYLHTIKEIKMEKITGLIDAPFTPFYANGEVNYEPIKAYAAMLRKNGLKGVFINGSSGEGYMLTEEERILLAEAWMKAAPEDFKVIVHVGSCSVKSSRILAEHAQKIGAWGIGAMAPPFPRIGRVEELAKYCEEIAAAAPNLPFYYYHIPAFNNAFLPMLELLKTVDGRIPNFAGIKYTYESIYEYNQCRLHAGGKFDMLHGQDETILPSLAMGGAQGGIGGTTNYNGRCLVGILEAWAAGDIENARELQNFSQEVINVICHFRGNIVGGKRIMKLLGLDLGPNRTPFQNMTDEEELRLKQELEEIDFFERCNKF